MIRQINIKNFKSILDHEIELGRTNVFIGENGSGKTNILEAIATASSTGGDKLDIEELYARGVRIAKPSITISSFLKIRPAQKIEILVRLDEGGHSELTQLQLDIFPEESDNINTSWKIESNLTARFTPDNALEVARLLIERAQALEQGIEDVQNASTSEDRVKGYVSLTDLIAPQIPEFGTFCIYNLNSLALRGIHVVSRRVPLGIYGENLDVFLSMFDKQQIEELLEHIKVISWLDKLVLDTEDELKFQGHKLGRSVSTLYFRDRFMRRRNNVFSAENANEGILHILFYLALFLSDKTPPFFGIDNIETSLNPQLCRDLMKTIARLAKKHEKQALITTHNPAILDGLNLHDDEQRLFVVYRNDQGHTETKRIRLKPDTGKSKYKLSELWMRGHLGGLPKTF